jgi:anti-sigma regulatory factor (Ser/Thr protein kinase)
MVALTYERTLELAAVPASASTARRLVRQALADCRCEQWGDAAELAVSELVTNAVLHAHTTLTVAVRCSPEGLHVEVRDGNPQLPAQRQYGDQATTGRGMTLVAAVTTSHGVVEIASGGKAVWFTIAAEEAEPEPEDLLDAWGDDDDLGAMPVPAGRTVTLVGLPPTLWLAAAEHHDGLLRELALHRHGHGDAVDDLVRADRARSAIRDALERALAAARAEGRISSSLPDNHPAPLDHVYDLLDVDVEVLGNDPAVDFAVLQDVLDEAERLAASGLLLARPGLPEVVALRDWAAESVIAQLTGQAPAPWAGADAERFAQLIDDQARQVDWDASVVRDAERGAVAADEGNRILAISSPLAQALGWDPDDLIGRRIVAIVPPRFREAHVAGFTRHLTTGRRTPSTSDWSCLSCAQTAPRSTASSSSRLTAARADEPCTSRG